MVEILSLWYRKYRVSLIPGLVVGSLCFDLVCSGSGLSMVGLQKPSLHPVSVLRPRLRSSWNGDGQPDDRVT